MHTSHSRARRRRTTVRLVATALAALLTVGVTACSTASEPTAPDPLATWNAAVADRADSPAKWVALGDSITEGQGASTRADRWTDLTRDELRRLHPTDGVTGGVGYVPAVFAVYAPDSTWADWAVDGSGTTYAIDTVPDLGYRALAMQPGATRTWPFTGTGLDIWWARSPDSGDFTYRIDGGAPQTVQTTGSETTGASTRVDGLTRGEHTVTVTAVATFALEGFTIYDGDRDAGIHLYDSARSGATIGTFTKDDAGFLRAMRRVGPDLVTITLGGNDAGHITPDELGKQYRAFLRALRSLPSKPSVLVVGEFTPAPAMTDGMSASWSTYLDTIERAAKSSGAAWVSMADTFPTATYSGTGIYSTDGLHPNDRGQRKISDLVLGALAEHDG